MSRSPEADCGIHLALSMRVLTCAVSLGFLKKEGNYMALIAMTTSDLIDYVSDRDPAKIRKQVPVDPTDPQKGTREEIVIGEGATVFKLRGLDVFLMGHIYDNASQVSGKQGSDEVGIKTLINKTNLEAVKHGLAGFVNFSDAKGRPIIFNTRRHNVAGRDYTVVEDSVLNSLGLMLIQELAEQIKKISDVSASEEKN